MGSYKFTLLCGIWKSWGFFFAKSLFFCSETAECYSTSFQLEVHDQIGSEVPNGASNGTTPAREARASVRVDA